MPPKDKKSIEIEEVTPRGFLLSCFRNGFITVKAARLMANSDSFTDEERLSLLSRIDGKQLKNCAAKNRSSRGATMLSNDYKKNLLKSCIRQLGNVAADELKKDMGISNEIWADAVAECIDGIKPAPSSLKLAKKDQVLDNKSSQDMAAIIDDLFEKKFDEVGGIIVKTIQDEVDAKIKQGLENQNAMMTEAINCHMEKGYNTLLRKLSPNIQDAIGEGIKRFGENVAPLIKEGLKDELFDSTVGKAFPSIHELKNGLEEFQKYQAALTECDMDPSMKLLLSALPPSQGYTLLRLHKVAGERTYGPSEKQALQISELISSIDDKDPAVLVCGLPIFLSVEKCLEWIYASPGGDAHGPILDPIAVKVMVDMGEPILRAEDVPTRLAGNKGESVVAAELLVDGVSWNVTCVSMGNPHCITFGTKGGQNLRVDELKLSEIGPKFEHHEMFPARTNTEFVEVLSRSHLKMRVWERGAGATLVCGTGACALVVAAVLEGRTDRKCRVDLPGGPLEIEWKEEDNHIYMTGPAELVFYRTALL